MSQKELLKSLLWSLHLHGIPNSFLQKQPFLLQKDQERHNHIFFPQKLREQDSQGAVLTQEAFFLLPPSLPHQLTSPLAVSHTYKLIHKRVLVLYGLLRIAACCLLTFAWMQNTQVVEEILAFFTDSSDFI